MISGIDYRKLKINETINLNENLNRSGGEYNKSENIPGIMIENTFNWDNKNIQFMSGLRLDNHNNHGYTLHLGAYLNITYQKIQL